MAVVDLVMPKLGESIMEATILKWHKNPGDAVRMDETVLEIATDKVDSEVPSTVEGIMQELLYQVNDVVPIGTVIAKIKTSVGENMESESAPSPATQIGGQNAPYKMHESRYGNQPESNGGLVASSSYKPTTNGNRFYSPLVLNIAASEGVKMQELEGIPGSGNEGRVTKKDILQYVSDRRMAKGGQHESLTEKSAVNIVNNKGQEQQEIQRQVTTPNSAMGGYTGNVEIIEMDRMRKLIARHMVESKHTSPHVTSFSESDVTNMVLWRERVKKEFEKRENEKITFTPLFIEAIIKCIKKYPWLNSSLDGDKLIVKKDINIGMATALPSGNLIVPVIKNADQLNLVGLTRHVNNLAQAARNNKLKPDDTSGGTFTLTNVGSFGSIMGTPIINQPQVAILAVGAIKKRPVVIETQQGDSIAIRHMMYLSLSYDHRIIDGALGATFLNAVAKELENFDGTREI
ncbi:MAG TPA: dihydrolipoamide acetyltransferase family protein [Flavitalea sp.]|nr:dihydrolipoamide acetyltransferase family protein [Flavitalea sp.]